MEKQKKTNQGITLIALVITIIVLLILAAISIGVLTGDNGIIKQSQQAKEETEIAEEKEVLNLSIAQATGEDVYGNLEEEPFRERLNNNAEGTELEKIGDNYKVTFPSDREYIVRGDGDINQIDKENTVELVAKLVYDYQNTGTYVIGVGFADYQLYYDFAKNSPSNVTINFLQEKTEKEKEKLFIDMMNFSLETNFSTIEELFKFLHEQGIPSFTNWEEVVEFIETEEYMSIEEYLAEELEFLIKYEGYKNDEYEEYLDNFDKVTISGTLIAPNGESFRLTTSNIESDNLFEYNDFFEPYCYKYPVNQNGEYTFTFYSDDGRYGKITLNINDQTPQIVSAIDFDSAYMMIMLGLNNFVNMEETKVKILGTTDNVIINATPYISNNIYGFPNNLKGIDLYEINYYDEISEDIGIFYGLEITSKYDSKEINRKTGISFLG